MAAQIARKIDRQGNIGCELLKRFTVVIDYSRNYVMLKPNKQYYREGFERDMSGIELRAKGENFRTFIIEKLQAGSPAAAAGLMPGDEILSMNGKMASQLRLGDILKMLQRGEGKEVKIFVRRDTELVFTSFFLKRMI
jgi:C-terminal processing protease CtpA/Prc